MRIGIPEAHVNVLIIAQQTPQLVASTHDGSYQGMSLSHAKLEQERFVA